MADGLDWWKGRNLGAPISIVQLSPYNTPHLSREILVLKAYFDGGKKDGRYVTLAGLISSEEIWKGFEARWGEVLAAHNLRWWHTTDAMNVAPGATRDFLIDPAKAWNRGIAEEAMAALSFVIL